MPTVDDLLDLADYRRRVAALYVEVRRRGASEETWRWWRDQRDHLFGTHPSSPYPPGERGARGPLPYFDHDPAFRVEAVVERAEPGVVEIAHSSAGSTTAQRFGRARFDLAGAACTLDVFWLEQYGGGLFVPFRDATSGTETYGGGRYVLDSAKSFDLGGHDGRLVLDFNYATHPSCVHDPLWSCPLAPPGNDLEVAVRAGERLGDTHAAGQP